MCDAPAGRLTGAAALRGFMEPFANMLTSAELLAAYGDQSSAVVIYDTASPAVASAPAAEFHQVRDGRITALRIVFDRLPFALARGEVVPRDTMKPIGTLMQPLVTRRRKAIHRQIVQRSQHTHMPQSARPGSVTCA